MAERKTNGLQVRTLQDLATVAVLVSLCFGVIAWGLKLENDNRRNTDEIANLKSQVGNGILPRAEERVRNLEQRVDRHEEKGH